MQINSSVLNIINPALSQQYPSATYRLRHVIGIDTSPLFVARIGVRNDNDLGLGRPGGKLRGKTGKH